LRELSPLSERNELIQKQPNGRYLCIGFCRIVWLLDGVKAVGRRDQPCSRSGTMII
jgi:hypothetical protein